MALSYASSGEWAFIRIRSRCRTLQRAPWTLISISNSAMYHSVTFGICPTITSLLLLISHALPCFPTVIEFPRHIGQALAFSLADAICVLGIETDLAILIDNLRMQGEDHVLFERNIGLRADGGILQHGHPDAMAGEMAQREAMFGEYVGDGPMHCRGKLAVTHQFARRFHGVGIGVGHFLRGRAGLALNQCAGKDRKSTRLNSSHSSISYAVFC